MWLQAKRTSINCENCKCVKANSKVPWTFQDCSAYWLRLIHGCCTTTEFGLDWVYCKFYLRNAAASPLAKIHFLIGPISLWQSPWRNGSEQSPPFYLPVQLLHVPSSINLKKTLKNQVSDHSTTRNCIVLLTLSSVSVQLRVFCRVCEHVWFSLILSHTYPTNKLSDPYYRTEFFALRPIFFHISYKLYRNVCISVGNTMCNRIQRERCALALAASLDSCPKLHRMSVCTVLRDSFGLSWSPCQRPLIARIRHWPNNDRLEFLRICDGTIFPVRAIDVFHPFLVKWIQQNKKINLKCILCCIFVRLTRVSCPRPSGQCFSSLNGSFGYCFLIFRAPCLYI